MSVDKGKWRIMTPDEVSAMNAPKCGAHRRYTSATCELPAHSCMFDSGHLGRDKLGRWHSWPRRMVVAALREAARRERETT